MRARLRALLHHLRTEHDDPARIGWAAGIGVFIGVIPLYGIQTVICLALASLLRLNKVTVVLAANISFPPFAPFLIAAGIAVGEWIRFGEIRPVSISEARDFMEALALLSGDVPDLFVSCFVGSFAIAVVLAPLTGLTAWRVAKRRRAAAET